ncbi:MAG: hypothetical protein HQL70_08645 [Magnetococcales bacterium]|nr:hypothetical protein [Magnetococcales bacterium]
MKRISTVLALIILAMWGFFPSASQAEPATTNPCKMEPNTPCNAKQKDTPKQIVGKQQKGFTSFYNAAASGHKMWNDSRLGTSGFTCLSGGCHANFENLSLDKNKTFPHYVGMAGKVVTLSQIINYCLVNPMAGSALAEDSDEMTAMAAFYRKYRMQYRQQRK